MFRQTLVGLGLLAACAACQPDSNGGPSTASAIPAAQAASPAAPAAVPQEGEFKAPDGLSEDEAALYFMGYMMGSNVRQFDLKEGEIAALKNGFLASVVPGAPEPEMQKVAPKIEKFVKSRNAAMVLKNKKEGEAYAEKMAAEGFEKTPDGYLFKSLTEGTGAQPTLTDRVKVHYTGTLIDGKKFDSSYDRPGADGKAEPATFPLMGVIKCWTQGLQKMKVGGKARLICPPELAYGDRPRPRIPGGSTLVFDVELVDIATPPPQKPAPSPVEGTHFHPATPTGPGGIPQNPPDQPQWRK